MHISRTAPWIICFVVSLVPLTLARAGSEVNFTSPSANACIWGGVPLQVSWSQPVSGETLAYDDGSPISINSDDQSATWNPPSSTQSPATASLTLTTTSGNPNVSFSLYTTPSAAVPLSYDSPQQTSLSLSWNQVNSTCVTGYSVYRHLLNGSDTQIYTTTSPNVANYYTDKGLTAGTSYYYRVDAFDAAGQVLTGTTVMIATADTATPTPTVTPSATPTATVTPSTTPTPISSLVTSPTPTATYNNGTSSSLLPASSSPSATLVPTVSTSTSSPLSATDRILLERVGAGLGFILIGSGLLIFYKIRTRQFAGVQPSEKKVLTPEVEPDASEPTDESKTPDPEK